MKGVKKIKPLRRKAVKVEKVKFDKATNHKEIKKLWLDNWTKTKIARHLNLSYSTVDKAILAMGIEGMQEVKKLKSLHPTKGKIPMTVPGVKGTYYVRPEKLQSFKEKYKIA